jgi:hypothetical protein
LLLPQALRLYHRDWRKIEAHVGTKTVVQIRSHAQKFFAKASPTPQTSRRGHGTQQRARARGRAAGKGGRLFAGQQPQVRLCPSAQMSGLSA